MNVELHPLCRDSKEEDEAVKPYVDSLWRLAANQSCFQCGQSAPRWLESHVGLVVCLTCSGFHRSLGVHLSMVRSLNLDALSLKNLVALQIGGNERALNALAAEIDSEGAHLAERGARCKAFFEGAAFAAYRAQVMKEAQGIMSLYSAIRLKNLFLVQQALLLVDFSQTGTYALHLACAKNAPSIVEELLHHSPPLNALCRGESPLMIAVRVAAWDIVRALLQSGCDVPSEWLKKQKKEVKEKLLPLIEELRSNLLEENQPPSSEPALFDAASARPSASPVAKKASETALEFSFFGYFPPIEVKERPLMELAMDGDPLGVPEEQLTAAFTSAEDVAPTPAYSMASIPFDDEQAISGYLHPSEQQLSSSSSRSNQSYTAQAKKYVNIAKSSGSKVVSYVKHWRTGGVSPNKTLQGPVPNLFGALTPPSYQDAPLAPTSHTHHPTSALARSNRPSEPVDVHKAFAELADSNKTESEEDEMSVDLASITESEALHVPIMFNPIFGSPMQDQRAPAETVTESRVTEEPRTESERPKTAYTFNVADLRSRTPTPRTSEGGDVWAMLNRIVGDKNSSQ